jgi:hypothetical protein
MRTFSLCVVKFMFVVLCVVKHNVTIAIQVWVMFSLWNTLNNPSYAHLCYIQCHCCCCCCCSTLKCHSRELGIFVLFVSLVLILLVPNSIKYAVHLF